nr:P12 [Hyposoter didymator ichnovirus]AAK15043.1 P12 precursor [Hyposoter didymator ichnovirus]
MNALLVLMSVFLLVAARPEPLPELPSHPRDFTDPTRSRSKDEAPKPHHHVVKKPGVGVLGTRIGFGDGPDPNQFWKFGEDANPRMMSTRIGFGDGPDLNEKWAFYP